MFVPSLSWQNNRFYIDTPQTRRFFTGFENGIVATSHASGCFLQVRRLHINRFKACRQPHRSLLTFLCVSRACLGKCSVFERKNGARKPFRTAFDVLLVLLLVAHVLKQLIIVDLCIKTYIFLSFPYVCPEPVLVNDDFIYKEEQKTRFSVPPSRSLSSAPIISSKSLLDNGTFFEFFLC